MSRKKCLQMKKDLREYLQKENLEIIDDLKKETSSPFVTDERIRPIKSRLSSPTTTERTASNEPSTAAKANTILDKPLVAKPVQIMKTRSCTCKSSLIVLLIALILGIAYTIGIISGITGQPFPFGWMTKDFPKVYY